ncbi:MAG: P-II family nitrogen regulator [Anaerolineae bacterium]|nr:P-II family nitrogen regulator [Anaerolineae bacterium]
MKKIEAFIKPDKLSFVKEALAKAGFPALTTYEVKGRGRQTGIVQTVNGFTLYADLLPKVKIEIVVQAEQLDRVIEVIVENARTGSIGDGKIFVSDIEEVVRVRTGERGKEAI